MQGEGPQSFLRFRVRSVVTTASNAGMSRTSVESIGTVAVDCVGDKMIGHRLIVRPLDARPLLPRQILLIELKHHLPVGNPPGLREARRHWGLTGGPEAMGEKPCRRAGREEKGTWE